MGTLEIEVGGIYANATGFLAREVPSIRDGIVEYRDFALEDGQPFSPCSRCSLYHFQRWSARPVTAEEASRLRREEADASLRAYFRTLIPMVLEAASDDVLRAEVRRRGWHLS